MLDRFDIKKNVSISVISFAVNTIVIFFTYRIVIHEAGLEVLGLWSLLMSWMFILRVGDIGMATAVLKYIAACDTKNEVEKIRVIVDTGMTFNGIVFIMLSILGYFVISTNIALIIPRDEELQSEALDVLPLIVFGFLIANLASLMSRALGGIHLSYVASWISVFGGTVQFFIVLDLVPKLGLTGLAIGQIAQQLCMFFLCAFFFRSTLKKTSDSSSSMFRIKFSFSSLKEMFVFSVKSQVASLLNGFFEPLSKILIGRFVGYDALGLYELAYKMVSLPRNSIVSGIQATIPSTTRLLIINKALAREVYGRSVQLSMIAATVLFAFLLSAAPLVSQFVLGGYEIEFHILVTIIGVGFFFNTISTPAFVLGLSSGILKYNLISSGFSLIILLAISLLSSKSDQIWGHVLGVAISLVLSGMFIKIRNQKLLLD